MLDAALDELRDAPRVPARRSPVTVANDAPTDELTAARADRNARRLLG
jgi:hypothetical protein